MFLRLTWPLTGASGSGDGCGQPSLNSGYAKTSPRSHGHCLAAADFWSVAFISALEWTQARGWRTVSPAHRATLGTAIL